MIGKETIERPPRVKFETKVRIESEKQVIDSTNCRNVSTNGIFVETDKRLDLGTKCKLEINLNSSDETISIKCHAEVSRIDQEGMAFKITPSDLESEEHLKRLVLYNFKD